LCDVSDDGTDNNDEYWDDLFEWFDGECAPERAAGIERWARSSAEIERQVENERARWMRLKDIAVPVQRVETLAALRALQRRRDSLERTHSVPVPTKPAHIVPLAFRVRAAAAVLLVAVGGVAALWTGRQAGWFAMRAASPPSRSFATKRGERMSLTLPDGSQAALAPDTRVVFTGFATDGPRSVALTGEAYFEIVHNSLRPFTVRAGNTITEDLGTRFSVRAYPGDGSVRVVVADGSVALSDTASHGQRPRALTAGTLGVVTDGGATTVTTGLNVDLMLGWRDGQLTFPGTPLGTAVRDLDRWYDIDVVLADSSLATLPVRGSLPATSVAAALDAIARVTGSQWEQRGRTVTFIRAGHPGARGSAAAR
jgi:transmembrane sensor